MSILVKQHTSSDCGPACLASICAYYHIHLSVATIRQYAGTTPQGTTFFGLSEAARHIGFEPKGIRCSVSAFKNITFPAIAQVETANGAHYVVIYQASGSHIKIMDPSDGKLHRSSTSQFSQQWSGALLLLSPGVNSKTAHKVSNYSRIWRLISPHKPILLQALLGAAVCIVLQLCTAVFIQKVTDHVLIGGDVSLLNLMGIIMIFIIFIQVSIASTKNIYLLIIGQQLDATLISTYFSQLFKLPLSFFNTMRTGEIISRVNDAIKIRVLISESAIGILINGFILICTFIFMLTFHWKLALLVIGLVPLYLLIYLTINKVNQKRQRVFMERSADMEAQMVENLRSMQLIKQFELEESMSAKIRTLITSLLQIAYQTGRAGIISISITELVSQLLIITLLWKGAGYVLNNEISPGELFSFYALIGYFTSPISSLIHANKMIQEGLIATERLFEIIELDHETSENRITSVKLNGEIIFENVSFRYGVQPYILDQFHLKLQTGCFTAITGVSGSGKSTLLYLLQNLYPVNKGRILLGGFTIDEIQIGSLRKLIGFVPQHPEILSGTLVENIAIGALDPDMNKIMELCIQLGLLDIIRSLPQGFNTQLGENGIQLSGGQKQLLATARALYRNPEILLLDEPTASLDLVAEKRIQQTLKQLVCQKKTVILISHRLNTIQQADHIVILDQGKIMHEGCHDVLLSSSDWYRNLWAQAVP